MRLVNSKTTMTTAYVSLLAASLCLGGACSSGSAPAAAPDGSTGGTSGGGSGSSSGVSGSSSGTSGGGSGSSSGVSGSSSGTSGGGSGSSSGVGPPTMGVCAGTGTRMLTTSQADSFIDDFEEATISPGWSSFNDVSPTINAFQITQVAGGAAGTAHSGHYAGTGAKTSTMGGFGVGTVYNTAIDPGAMIYCVDISVFTGVSFWAKAAKAGSTISLNFVLPTTNMQMITDAGVNTGGDCTMNCFNHPRVQFTLTTQWAQYTAPFAMAGGGTAKVQAVIQELAWLSPDSDWDFTLDEIAFYAGTPPTGAVGPNPNGGGGTPDAGGGD
jgi:hypothetical protein